MVTGKKKLGKKRKKSRKAVRSTALIKILEITRNFAPSAEDCSIKYNLKRTGKSTLDKAKLVIKDKDKNIIYDDSGQISSVGDGIHVTKWNGKDKNGKYVSPLQSPFTVSIEMMKTPKIKDEKKVTVEIKDIYLWIDANNNKFVMNDPEQKVAIVATVMIKTSAGGGACTKILIDVVLSFSDPPPNNTREVDSFKYQTGPDKYLGKGGNVNAIHWENHPDCVSSSPDGYKTKCKVTTIASGDISKLGKAKIYFKPSGVGGDDFKLKAIVYATDGATELASKEGNLFTIWRLVKYDKIYEMNGENHVSTNATAAIIGPVFTSAFVEYKVGPRTAISAAKSVKYIGLWKDSTTPQESWANIQIKKPDENPTPAEIREATYSGADPILVIARDISRIAIIAKAQKWTNRIDAAFFAAMDKWIADAGIPEGALVAIKYYHPKYSHGGSDFSTNEWNLGGASTPAWLRVKAFHNNYTNLDPDGLWVNWAGLSHSNGIVTVPKGNANAVVIQTVKHETGHHTKKQKIPGKPGQYFKREEFGPSLDHSASNAGIMYATTAGGTTFTDREKKILRGIKP